MISQPKRTRLPSIHSLSLDLPSFNFQRQMPVPVPQYGYQPYITVPALTPTHTTPYEQTQTQAPYEQRFSPISSPELNQYHYQSVYVPVKSPSVVPNENKRPLEEDEISSDEESKKNSKPRKKRQCPECKLYFSNLATHKSTHLKPTSRPHICKYCNRGFARPNDLFRHVKCHWKEIGSDKGQFKCPFKKLEETGDETDHCCHNTGIFSRCDTFKNHLKAIHFQYPNGTKKDQRMKVAGKCRMCQVEFKNVDDWLVNHVERNGCAYAINLIKKET